MIKETELRIGNNLYESTGEVGTVISGNRRLELSTECRGNVSLEECAPIPLTPEWLERLGFIKKNYRYHGDPESEAVEAFVKGAFVIRLIDVVERKTYLAEYIPYSQSQNSIPGRIDYVHQLQNKYYFWTDGEELTINNEHFQTTSSRTSRGLPR